MGDYKVHRVRIGDWVPSPIKSIASDSLSTKIAVGRTDGDIEICDSANKWYTQARISGQKDFQLQSLLWSTMKEEQGRLFGVSLRGFLFEVDLVTLRIKNIRDSYGGAAWCMAGCPRTATIAVGCEDGAVRLYTYSGDGTTLEYQKTLPTSGSRIVSIAYHPVEPLLFIGCSDGTVRCMEESNGRVKYRLTGNVLKGKEAPVIWSLLVMRDSTVVTGDSTGHVQLWDGVNGVMIGAHHQHSADVLALTANKDESCFFASGIDGKVACFQKTLKLPQSKAASNEEMELSASAGDMVELSLSAAADNNWIYSHSHRAHTHDVYTLALCYTPPDASTSSSSGGVDVTTSSSSGYWILLSGGLDTKMCTYSATDFGRVRPSWIPSVPSNALVNHSQRHDVLALRHRQHLDIWHVELSKHQPSENSESSVTSQDEKACQLMLRLQSKGNDHIHASALSPNGKYVSIASSSGVRLWYIHQNHPKPVIASSSSSGGGGVPPVTPGDNKKGKKAKGKASAAATAAVNAEASELTPQDASSTVDSVDPPLSASLPIELKSISLPKTLTNPRSAYQAVQFNSASSQLAVYEAVKGELSLYDITVDVDPSGEQYIDVTLACVIENTAVASASSSSDGSSNCAEWKLAQAVKSIRFSGDGQLLAVTSCSREVYVFDIVSRRLHWKLPRLACSVSDVQFIRNPTNANGSSSSSSSSNPVLLVLLSNNTFLLFDVTSLKLHPWSVANTVEKFPTYLRQMPGALCGVSADPADANRLLLYGQGYCVFVRLNEKIPSIPKVVNQTTTALLQKSLLKKRKYLSEMEASGLGNTSGNGDKKKGSEESSNFIVVNIYRNLLHIGALQNSQLVVVENPWIRTAEQMPDTIARKRYGT